MKRTLLLVIPPALALVALGALTQPRSPAADPPAKSGPNVAPPEQAAKAKNRVDADAVSDVALAHALAAYGHRTHSAEALVMAASIMGKYGTTPLGVAATMDRGGRGHRAGEPATSSAGAGAVKPPAMTAKGLLDDAKKMAGANAAVTAMANNVHLQNAVGGPKTDTVTAPPNTVVNYKITYTGGEVAKVGIGYDVPGRLDLYVYDENGNLARAFEGYDQVKVVSWVPKWTGVFVVKVANPGDTPIPYTLLTN